MTIFILICVGVLLYIIAFHSYVKYCIYEYDFNNLRRDSWNCVRAIAYYYIRAFYSIGGTIQNIFCKWFYPNPFEQKNGVTLIYKCPKKYPNRFKNLYEKDIHFRQMYNWLFCSPKGVLNKIQSHYIGILFLRYFIVLAIIFFVSYIILDNFKDMLEPEGGVPRIIAYLIMGNIYEETKQISLIWLFVIFIFIMCVGSLFMAAITKKFVDEKPALVFAPKIFFDPNKRSFTVLCQNQDFASLTDVKYFLGVSLLFNGNDKKRAFFEKNQDKNMCLFLAALNKNAVSIDPMVTFLMETLTLPSGKREDTFKTKVDELCSIIDSVNKSLSEKDSDDSTYKVLDALLGNIKKNPYRVYYDYKDLKNQADLLRKNNPSNDAEKLGKILEDIKMTETEDIRIVNRLFRQLYEDLGILEHSVQNNDDCVSLKGKTEKLFSVLTENPHVVNYFYDDLKNLAGDIVNLMFKNKDKNEYNGYKVYESALRRIQTTTSKEVDYAYEELAASGNLLTLEHRRKAVQLYPILKFKTSNNGKDEFLFEDSAWTTKNEQNEKVDKLIRVIIHAKSVTTGTEFIWQKDYTMDNVICGCVPNRNIEVHRKWYEADIIDMYNGIFDNVILEMGSPEYSNLDIDVNRCSKCNFSTFNCPLKRIKPCSENHLSSIIKLQESVLKDSNEKERLLLQTTPETLKKLLENDGMILGAFSKNRLVAYIAMSKGDNDRFKDCLDGIDNNERKKFAFIEHIIVEKDYCGLDLQNNLLQALEVRIGNNPNFKYMGALVSAESKSDLDSFNAAGFEIVLENGSSIAFQVTENSSDNRGFSIKPDCKTENSVVKEIDDNNTKWYLLFKALNTQDKEDK